MTNKLAGEPSRYLRQHAENPVLWRPWGESAFDEAAKAGKPLLLSIGYSSCHWCHVMAHESFEDTETAALINDLFIAIKIDKEEYPDVDGFYMSFLSQLTGNGGWPLNVFVNPHMAPFYGLTYLPKNQFDSLLRYVNDEYQKNETLQNQKINTAFSQKRVERKKVADLIKTVEFPPVSSGAGPQFPQGLYLAYALSSGHEKMATDEFEQLVLKGLFDHIEGGWFRYSVDPGYKIPHFEKMLYDQAVMLRLCAAIYRQNREVTDYAIAGALAWLLKHMKLSSGLFGSATDADTPDGEGYYYTLSEVNSELEAELFRLDRCGKHEKRHLPWLDFVLYRDNPEESAGLIQKRTEERENFHPPQLDKKAVYSWNAFLASSLYACFAATGVNNLKSTADGLLEILGTYVTNDVLHLPHVIYEDGQTKGNRYLEDYASYLLLLSQSNLADLEKKRQVDAILHAIEELFVWDNRLWHTNTRIFENQSLWQDTPFPAGGSLLLNALVALGYQNHPLAELLHTNIAEISVDHPVFFSYWLAGFAGA